MFTSRCQPAGRTNWSALTALTALSALPLLSACKPSPRADTIVYGKTWTGDSARPWVTAVAIAGDSLLATGDSAARSRMAGPKTTVISGAGGLVVPVVRNADLLSMAEIERRACTAWSVITSVRAHRW